MEAHPHPVHHEKKWKDYLFEFLMLFLAVTAGFFMENQREHYTEKQRVREYARSLIQDLIRDTTMLKETITRINNSVLHIDRFAEFLEGKQISNLRNIDLYKYTFFWMDTDLIPGTARPLTKSKVRGVLGILQMILS